MKRSPFFLFATVAMISSANVFISCNGSSFGSDPEGAEIIYSPATVDEDRFSFENIVDRDGFTSKNIEHHGFAFTNYCALYTPANNLKLVLACCSESLDLYGYKVDYDEDGNVRAVTRVQEVEVPDASGYNPRLLKSWVKDRSLEGQRFEISRDDNGTVTSVGDIYVPYGYTAKYFIKEWGPFWDSDINGGVLGFFVLLEADEKQGKSAVDYLYFDGNLIAELAYWNGTFIKALYYNCEGRFFGIDENRDADVLYESHDVYSIVSRFPWYLDTRHISYAPGNVDD